MGVKNFPLYEITDHARVRIQNRFNITKNEMEGWTSRLLSQAIYVSSQDHNREKHRLNDIVVIVDTRQKMVVTVYSENEHDDNSVHSHTNPEVKSVINEALKTMVKQKKVKTINLGLYKQPKTNKFLENFRTFFTPWNPCLTSRENIFIIIQID